MPLRHQRYRKKKKHNRYGFAQTKITKITRFVMVSGQVPGWEWSLDLHLIDGRKVMHADDVFWALRGLGNVAHRDGRGVCRDDAVLGHNRLHLLDDVVLDLH